MDEAPADSSEDFPTSRVGLDGFESPYLGRTGSWDGKGGSMMRQGT